MKILRKEAVSEKVGYTAVHISKLAREGRFPLPVKLGPGPKARVVWIESEVDAWLEERVAESRRKVHEGSQVLDEVFPAAVS